MLTEALRLSKSYSCILIDRDPSPSKGNGKNLPLTASVPSRLGLALKLFRTQAVVCWAASHRVVVGVVAVAVVVEVVHGSRSSSSDGSSRESRTSILGKYRLYIYIYIIYIYIYIYIEIAE